MLWSECWPVSARLTDSFLKGVSTLLQSGAALPHGVQKERF
jgi:hypothetical protein